MKILLIICTLLTVSNLKSQSYIPYFNLVNEGNKNLYYKNYQLAADKYEQAIKSVSYTHNATYANAAIAFSNVNNYKKAAKYLEKAIKQGWNRNYTLNGVFMEKGFTATKDYKNLMFGNSIKTLSYDSVFIYKIDSLYNIDQNIIRAGGQFKESTTYSDSLIFAEFLKLIKIHGFPSEQNIGQECIGKAAIIIHHNGRLPKNETYLPTWLDAVKKGWLMPETYAWMYDQYLVWFKENKPYFYQCIARIDKLSEAELNQVLNNRRNIGLSDFDAYDIKADDYSFSFTKKY
jgi:tetratricopeptide (TPR) repeat protein